MKVSLPCETAIARNFRREVRYPYLDAEVLEKVGELDPALLRPRSMEDRKAVLKKVADDLGFSILAHRTKKASQYGSGTTDLIRDAARAKGVRYNRYISDIYEGLGLRNANLLRDAAVDVRLDPILLHDAEEVLRKEGVSHSEAVAMFYRRIAEEGGLEFLGRPAGSDLRRCPPRRDPPLTAANAGGGPRMSFQSHLVYPQALQMLHPPSKVSSSPHSGQGFTTFFLPSSVSAGGATRLADLICLCIS